MPRTYFSVVQEGLEVASGDAPDAQSARREAMHYAMMYAQDGPPVTVAISPLPEDEGYGK